MPNKVGTTLGAFRVVKKAVYPGYPYYAAIDLPTHEEAWYLRANGTIRDDCDDSVNARGANSGWFASMADIEEAIKLYEEKSQTC